MGEQEPMEPFFFTLGRELDGVFFIQDWEVRDGVFRFKGRLLVDPERALKVLSERYAPYGYYPFIQSEEEIALLKAAPRKKASKPWVNLVLLFATLLTTLLAGSFNAGINPFRHPWGLIVGLPFSLSLLAILGTHELGHYFVGRRYGIDITLPFFIPAPPIPPLAIGTFGALIKMKSPPTDRKSLFDVGLAGPIAGLSVAIPVVIIGLKLSKLIPLEQTGQFVISLGTPILFAGIQHLVLGPIPEGYDVLLHPVAFAGWFGLFVTALNLLPMGQLDGGHVSYALLGRRHAFVAWTTFGGLILMGTFFWPGWLFWAAIALALGLKHPPPLNDLTPLDRRRRIIGVLALLLFLSLITPSPFTLYEP